MKIEITVGKGWYTNSVGTVYNVYKITPDNQGGMFAWVTSDSFVHDGNYITLNDTGCVKPISTVQWLYSRQDELQTYVIDCLENGVEIDKSISLEFYKNQQRILEIEQC